MFTAYQVLELGIAFVMMLAAVWGIVAKSQRTLQEDLKADLETLKQAHAKGHDDAEKQFSQVTANFQAIGLQLNTILEGHVRELQARVTKLESGQDEWTKTLRERTHELSNSLNTLVLKVDRLERPQGPR